MLFLHSSSQYSKGSVLNFINFKLTAELKTHEQAVLVLLKIKFSSKYSFKFEKICFEFDTSKTIKKMLIIQ